MKGTKLLRGKRGNQTEEEEVKQEKGQPTRGCKKEAKRGQKRGKKGQRKKAAKKEERGCKKGEEGCQTEMKEGCKQKRKKGAASKKRGQPTWAHGLVNIMMLEVQTLPNHN